MKSKAEQDIWLKDVPESSYGIDDVLIEVLKTGICGTEMHIYNLDSWAHKTGRGGDVNFPGSNGESCGVVFRLTP